MLRVGYYLRFKGERALLFSGAKADIAVLSSELRRWAGEKVDLIERLQGVGGATFEGIRYLALEREENDAVSQVSIEGDHGTWLMSKSTQARIVELLQALEDSESAGHQYLDINKKNDVQIIVAKDEYGLGRLD